MSYQYRIINDRPKNFYPLTEGATNFNDFAGISDGLVNGSPLSAPPLVVGGGNSYLFTGSDNFRFKTKIFQSNTSSPFSLEAWFKPVNVNGIKGIIGHLNSEDGLTFDGEKIVFSTTHGTAGTCRAIFYPENKNTSFHVVGVHNGLKNELYVNGVMVASSELTYDQSITPYSIPSAPGFLYCGHRPGSILIDSVAVYDSILSIEDVRSHFKWGRETIDYQTTVPLFSGVFWNFLDQDSSVEFSYSFPDKESWTTGQHSSVILDSEKIVPVVDDFGNQLAGSWQNGFILSAATGVLSTSKIEWTGQGNFVVETSLDNGVQWSIAENGRAVPGITDNYTALDKALLVRITFPKGNIVSSVSSLRINLYSSRDVVASLGGQTANLVGKASLSKNYYSPIENNALMGLYLYGGSVILNIEQANTLEIFVRPETLSAGTTIYDTGTTSLSWDGGKWVGSSTTTYIVNGVQTNPEDMSIPVNRWTHIVAILPSLRTTPITVGQNLTGSIGFFSVYPGKLSTGDAQLLYTLLIAGPNLLTKESLGVVLREPTPALVEFYSHDWSLITSS